MQCVSAFLIILFVFGYQTHGDAYDLQFGQTSIRAFKAMRLFEPAREGGIVFYRGHLKSNWVRSITVWALLTMSLGGPAPGL